MIDDQGIVQSTHVDRSRHTVVIHNPHAIDGRSASGRIQVSAILTKRSDNAMNIRPKAQNEFEVEFYRDEIRIVYQALNEACHGLAVPDFSNRIRHSATAESEIKELSALYMSEHHSSAAIRRTLKAGHLELYQDALKEVCDQIEEWEFDTRMGVSKREAQGLIEILQRALARITPCI